MTVGRAPTCSWSQRSEAAQAVARLLHPHFEKEEKYAQPPLGLPTLLAKGKVNSEMEKAIALTDLRARRRPSLPRPRGGLALPQGLQLHGGLPPRDQGDQGHHRGPTGPPDGRS